MKLFIIFSVVMLVLGALVLGSDANSNCPSICTADYRPVCAGNGRDKPRTFSNKCALDVHNCGKSHSKRLNLIKNTAC